MGKRQKEIAIVRAKVPHFNWIVSYKDLKEGSLLYKQCIFDYVL